MKCGQNDLLLKRVDGVASESKGRDSSYFPCPSIPDIAQWLLTSRKLYFGQRFLLLFLQSKDLIFSATHSTL